MNKKLTLLLDEVTIDHAKKYAQKNQQSLSQLVETYFRYLTRTTARQTPKRSVPRGVVAELSGIVKIPDSLDIKQDYREHRAEKALHD